VAVGRDSAETGQGDNSIAIGNKAGQTNQGANGIIINSRGLAVDQTTPEHIILQSASTKYLEYNGTDTWTFSGGDVTVPNDSLLVGTTTKLGQLTTRLSSGSTPVHAVQHYSSVDAGWYMLRFFNGSGASGGGITLNTSDLTVSYNTTSDERLKENVVDAPAGNIDSIKVRSFDWKSDGEHQEYGFIAQELETVAPYAVSKGETDEDMWAVDYSKLVPMLVKEIQDLKAEVAALKGA
jgi:hypothetical protein